MKGSMAMATNIDDRVSRIEGALPYLATKEDIARLATRIEQVENRLLVKLTGVMVLLGAVMTLLFRFL